MLVPSPKTLFPHPKMMQGRNENASCCRQLWWRVRLVREGTLDCANCTISLL